MNLIVVGASHRSASITLLERLSRVGGPRPFIGEHVAEAVLLSTCNRTDIYAVVPAFHAGLQQIGEVLARETGVSYEELSPSVYVHHGVNAVRHAFRVAAGLESMVVGEPQILGQLRDAYQNATDADTVGRVLHELMQQALRVGKRAHAETDIDRAPRSVVSAALALAPSVRRWAVVGAGAMGSLARAHLAEMGAAEIAVVRRANTHELPRLLSEVDGVVCATASVDPVITKSMVTKPLVIVDLAMPRDVEPDVRDLPGVTLIDLETLGASIAPAYSAEVHEVERIVEDEVQAYAGWLRGAEAAPTVAALRARAEELVSTELRRLTSRRPDLTDAQRADVAHTVHRIVQRLLHQPTVRVRQLAAEPGGEAYTRLVRELFELDTNVTSVSDVPEVAE
ncbi:glutamyl-tRNA reductase [Allorhizocola rhizosphaerae]|uniref:glutamyl-tRNA reductase n=1 Tax=Allorhizocola rhizosphaerae TaxID=1872709 RepID=UPI000E3E26C0|nr:glutamyl-tRNA reductase [Allorhizocola rhizosphaerae]